MNSIEISFYGGGTKEKEIREAWKAYHDQLCVPQTDDNRAEWNLKHSDLFIDLPYKMAKCLNYDFDKTQIKNSWYSPKAHGMIEDDWHVVRSSMAQILSGNRSLPVYTPYTNEEAAEHSEIRKALLSWLKGTQPQPRSAFEHLIDRTSRK